MGDTELNWDEGLWIFGFPVQAEAVFNSVDSTPILGPIHVCLRTRKSTCLFPGLFIHAETTAVLSG